MNTYIYSLENPITKEIKYIGKTDYPNKRYTSHICLKGNKGTYLKSWIINLQKTNIFPAMRILKIVSADEWKYWEEKRW